MFRTFFCDISSQAKGSKSWLGRAARACWPIFKPELIVFLGDLCCKGVAHGQAYFYPQPCKCHNLFEANKNHRDKKFYINHATFTRDAQHLPTFLLKGATGSPGLLLFFNHYTYLPIGFFFSTSEKEMLATYPPWHFARFTSTLFFPGCTGYAQQKREDRIHGMSVLCGLSVSMT